MISRPFHYPINRPINKPFSGRVEPGDAWTIADLFKDGQDGMWIDFRQGYVFADTDLTTPANPGEGIAGYVDRGPYGYDGTQPVITARPIFRVGPPRAEYDGADDVLPSSRTIPSISDGCFILVGTAGIWIDNEYSNTSGTLSVGPTTYTGGPAGILGVVGDVLSIVVRNEPLTDQERQKVIQAGVKRGSPGLIEVGPELVVNGDFSDGTSNWILSNNCSVVDGLGVFSGVVIHEGFYQNVGTVVGAHYLAEFDLVSLTSGFVSSRVGGVDAPIRSAVGRDRSLITAVNNTSFGIKSRQSGTKASIDNVSLRRLILPGETP